jgi:hypothetical protein
MSRDIPLPATGTRSVFVASSPIANRHRIEVWTFVQSSLDEFLSSSSAATSSSDSEAAQAAGWLSWQPDGSIGGSWPTAFFGYPRGHTVGTEAWCRSTLAKLAIRYSPSTVEPQTSERMLPDQQRSERIQALKLLVLSVSSDRSSLPSSKGLKQSPRVCAPR